MLALLAGSEALAQARNAPPQPPSGHQTEAVDLNEGKSANEMFQLGCAVCHQSAAGLAKGRRERELTSFLRQHYTSGVQHAAALAGFLASTGARGGPASVTRGQPVDRPPAPIGSRRAPSDEDAQEPQERRRKPQEASRSPDREPAAKRRAADRPGRAAPVASPAPAATASTESAADNPEPSTSAVSPPAEEKPQPPEIPL